VDFWGTRCSRFSTVRGYIARQPQVLGNEYQVSLKRSRITSWTADAAAADLESGSATAGSEAWAMRHGGLASARRAE